MFGIWLLIFSFLLELLFILLLEEVSPPITSREIFGLAIAISGNARAKILLLFISLFSLLLFILLKGFSLLLVNILLFPLFFILLLYILLPP